MTVATFRQLRESRHLTQDALAARIGCPQTIVSYYERYNRLTNSEHLEPLARALGVTTDVIRSVLVVTELSHKQIRLGLPENGKCDDCKRQLYARMGTHTTLECPDFCRWCGRAKTDAGRARAPLDGFVAVANGSARRAAAGRTTAVFGDEE